MENDVLCMTVINLEVIFHKLYTVHGYLNGHYIPLVRCMLSNKATATCVHAEHDTSQLCSSKFVFLTTRRSFRFWNQHAVCNSVSSPQCVSTLL